MPIVYDSNGKISCVLDQYCLPISGGTYFVGSQLIVVWNNKWPLYVVTGNVDIYIFDQFNTRDPVARYLSVENGDGTYGITLENSLFKYSNTTDSTLEDKRTFVLEIVPNGSTPSSPSGPVFNVIRPSFTSTSTLSKTTSSSSSSSKTTSTGTRTFSSTMSISSTSDAESTESSSTTIPIGPGSKSLSTAAIVAIALGSVLFLLLILLLLLFMRRRRKRERMAEKQVSNDDGVFDEYDALEDSNADMDGSAITAGLSGKIVTDTKNEDFSTFGGSPPFQDPKAVAGVYGDYELPSIMSSPMVFAGPQRSTRTNSQGSNKSNFAGGGPTKMGSPGSGFVLDGPNHSTSFTELDARIVGKGFRDALDKAPENDLIKSDEEDGQGGDNSTPEHGNWRETIAHDRMQRALEQDKSIKVVDLHHKATPFSTAGLQSTKFSVKSDKPLSTTSLSSPDPDAPSDSTDKTEPDT